MVVEINLFVDQCPDKMLNRVDKSSVTFREQRLLAFSFACYSLTFNVMILFELYCFFIPNYCPFFYTQQLKGPLYSDKKHLKKEPLNTAYSYHINNYKHLCAVFVRGMINTHGTAIYFCPEQCQHKSQTFDGSNLHSFSTDGDIRAYFPPLRGSHSLPFIPVAHEKQLPQCNTIHHSNYQACIWSVLSLSQWAGLSIFRSL